MRPSQPSDARVGRSSSRHHTTSVVSPKVQIIAMPDPFSGSASGCASTGTSTPNSGVVTVWPNRVLEALVVGVRHQRDARRDQLGAGGLDDDVGVAVGAVEADRVVRAGQLAVLELGLRDRGAEVDVPQRRRLGLVRLAAGEVAEERPLRRPLRVVADRRVGQRPVDRQPGGPPQLLERLLVLGGEPLAQLDEVAPRRSGSRCSCRGFSGGTKSGS